MIGRRGGRVTRRQKPRSARTKRRQSERQESDRYRRLFERARRLSFEPTELNQAVGQEPTLLGAALTRRYAMRRRALDRNPALLPSQGWVILALIPPADAVLTKAGAGWSLAPDLWGRPTWADILRWGLDKAADTCRLLRVGATYGAIVLARAQLERWTLNVAFHHKVAVMAEAESTADYMRRVWSVYPQIGREFDAGQTWTDLSEWLHGRGQISDALGELWDEGNLEGPGALTGSQGPESRMGERKMGATVEIHERISAVIDVTMRQVRGGVTLLAEGLYGHKFTAALQLTVDKGEGDRYRHESDFLRLGLQALDYQVSFSEIGKEAIRRASSYRYFVGHSGTTDLLASGTSPGLAEGAMLERRGRAFERARQAFLEEEKTLGDAFNPGSLGARLFRYFTIGEAALMVAEWTSGPEADALRAASSALQSAWWLWLEDTDDAMPCVRGVLEQTCRARAHRVKPVRAARVEAMGAASTPARWLEAAGWKRLAVLGRALGEFAHVSFRARWSGARDALTALQSGEDAHTSSTARGHALEAAAYLLAYEVATRLDQATPAVGAAFREGVTLLDVSEHDSLVEDLLQRCLDLRAADFGQPDLHPVTRRENPS